MRNKQNAPIVPFVKQQATTQCLGTGRGKVGFARVSPEPHVNNLNYLESIYWEVRWKRF